MYLLMSAFRLAPWLNLLCRRQSPAPFDGPTIELDDQRRDYGERRIIAYGAVDGRVLVCVYTWRGSVDAPVRWVISLRRAKWG